ncbi:hypothetical protein HUT18_23475 [Streptomyces sp. NA04227]|uniref:hypothetical protein n=1 Tax=Streptomyces sp. NA04227 TaxID=2742136 RepID=UPI00159076D9|nr:hypothetical protein [Streptomyces sp. NA04227]QKW08899.1 hypothetical protein HUT18_23475 [Streptomyces sp. NA04227]
MPIWEPEPGETMLARVQVVFATGAATAVKGMRWFRDTERRDIQDRLPGWPAGPEFVARGKSAKGVRGVGGVLGRIGYVAVMIVLTAAGGLGPGPGTLGRPDEPENEVDDFPVLWGDPDSVAATLPWQMDLGRRPRGYRTHLIVTDSRLVVVGFTTSDTIDDEVLWEIDRARVAKVETRDFSAIPLRVKDLAGNQCDLRIDFTDGSWCRVASNYREDLAPYLVGSPELVPLSELTEGQRQRVDRFSENYDLMGDPVVLRLDNGNFRMAGRGAVEVSDFSGMFAPSDLMDSQGSSPGR